MCAKTWLTEDMTTGLTSVRTEVDIQTDSTGEVLPVLLVLLLLIIIIIIQQQNSHMFSLDINIRVFIFWSQTAEGKNASTSILWRRNCPDHILNLVSKII